MQDDVESCCIIFNYPDNDQEIKKNADGFLSIFASHFYGILKIPVVNFLKLTAYESNSENTTRFFVDICQRGEGLG